VSCVIACSFARIFFRNAINIGLPVLECPEVTAQKGDQFEINLETGRIENKTSGKVFTARPVPEFLRYLFELGGLVPYVKARLEASS
jgi:3-isopropylmalate/(R)-2-methylmalate dehydratase small subunit